MGKAVTRVGYCFIFLFAFFLLCFFLSFLSKVTPLALTRMHIVRIQIKPTAARWQTSNGQDWFVTILIFLFQFGDLIGRTAPRYVINILLA